MGVCRERSVSDKTESGKASAFSLLTLRSEDLRLFCGGKVGIRKLPEGGAYGLGTGNDHNVEAGQKTVLVQTINFPQATAYPIAHDSATQLFADGDANAILSQSIFSGIERQKAVRLGGCTVKTAENMIQF